MREIERIYIPVIQGMAVTATFIFTEIVLTWFGAFNNEVRLYLVDIPLRLLFGTIALLLLVYNTKKQRSHYSIRELFTNKIPSGTYLLLLPFVVYLVVTLLPMTVGEEKELSANFAGMYSINLTQQLATGYFEEGTRALLMCGLLKYCIDTTKKRLQAILISGVCFGLSHILNFLFGKDIISTLWQVFYSFIWGLLLAAIYMLSKNLTLIMIIHAIWDIVIKIPNTFYTLPESSMLLDAVSIIQLVLQFVITPAVAVYICIKYDKLR